MGSCNGFLHGIDRQTGRRVWTYNAGLDGGKPEFHGRPLITSDLVVIASDDRRSEGVGYVYAFERPSLRLRWKRRLGAGAMTDIVQAGDHVLVVSLNDELTALDLQTGAIRWTFPSGTPNPQCLPSSTPAIAAGRVVFVGLDGTAYGLDTSSGKAFWHRALGARVSTSVASVGAEVFVGDVNGTVHRLDARSGDENGHLGIEGVPRGHIVPTNESLLLFANRASGVSLVSIRGDLGGVRWLRDGPDSGWSSFSWPHVVRGTVVVGTESGRYMALRLTDGEPEWDGVVKGRVAGIGGDETVLLVGTTNGAIYARGLPNSAR